MNGADFSAGGVLGRSFEILGKHFVPFVVLAALMNLPALGYQLLADSESRVAEMVGTILEMLAGLMAQGAVAYGVFQALRGTPASLGQCISVGLGRLLPVLGVALLTGLAVAVGLILLIVPGLIVFTMLYVAVPVAVIEEPGVSASLTRSQELTKGYRWSIFGVVVLLFLVNFGVAFLLGLTLGGTSLATWLIHGLSIVLTALTAVTAAVAYHDLRVAKEGVTTDQLAGVFD